MINKICMVNLLDVNDSLSMMEELFEEFKQSFSQYEPSVLIGGSVTFVLFVILLVLSCKKVIFSGKKLQEAKEKGYMVVAHLVSYHFGEHDSGSDDDCICIARYEYEFKGRRGSKVMTWHNSGYGRPVETITLYHNGRTSRLYTDTEMSGHNKMFFVVYLLPIIIGILVATIIDKFFG